MVWSKHCHLHLNGSLLSSTLQRQPKKPDIINLNQTKQLHAHLLKTPLQNPTFTPPFNFLITSYTKNNHPIKALNACTHMRNSSFSLDNFTIPSVLKALILSRVSVTLLGKELHGHALKVGFAENDVFVGNALMHFYSECGLMGCARVVFDGMVERDCVSWSSMIRGYCRNKMFRDAVGVMRAMWSEGVRPSEVAAIGMVGVFVGVEDLGMGRVVHGYVVRNFGLRGEEGVRIMTCLVDLYAKCGRLDRARRVFDGLREKSVASWTAMIAGCVRCNELREGAVLFGRMVEEGVVPTEITMLSLVIECGFAGALDVGKQVHGYVLRNGFGLSSALATALVDMYGKCGGSMFARGVFDGMVMKDINLWSSMISAYARASCFEKAFDLLLEMKDKRMRVNEMAMVSLLSLCGESGALDKGKWLHSYIDDQNMKVDLLVKTALVDMYAKCGDIEGAERLFSKAENRDICLWNAMISGFAMHGCGKAALELLSEMERQDTRPNDVTFIGVLHACAHAGLVEEGKLLFDKMVSQYGLVPKIEHYGCMVDILGRAGLLEEACDVIKKMPMSSNTIIWGALLAACKLHKNAKIGEMAAKQLLKLEPQNTGYNVLVSNIYASQKRWDDFVGMRTYMRNSGIKKQSGFSAIETDKSRWLIT